MRVASRDSPWVERTVPVLTDVPMSADGGAPVSGVHVRTGDAARLEGIARQELPRVERLLRRLLGPRSDMEDLVQTVFLETCRALPGFRGDSSISTFVGGITVRVARRAMRPSAWARLRSREPMPTLVSSDRPDRGAIAAEQLRRVERVLETLSADKRIAFSLWALEGMDPQSIAELTGASLAATRSRIFYAQKALREAARRDAYLAELVEGSDAG
jgi:RNA polymerase sigma-70 factor (ECF subfamily)